MASVSRKVDSLHKRLLIDLGDMMDPENPTYKNFIRCLVSDDLPLEKLSVVQQNPTNVFDLMEEKGVLKAGKYQYLEEALKASQYMSILDHLKEAEKGIARQMRKRSYVEDPMDGTYVPVSCGVVNDPQVIKRNLVLQYNVLLEETEPMHLQKTFIDRRILKRSFFEELKKLQRRTQMDIFLKKILDIGSEEAIIALIDALKDGGDEDLAENLCHVETEITVPRETDVQEIQLLLIKVYEHIQVISMSPVFDSAVNLKNLEDFYTDIVIEEEIEESVQQRKNEKKDTKEKVTSVRQLFEKGNKKVTRVILKAPAGQGKSTFCRKLVHTWCSVQKKKLNLLIDATTVSDRSERNGLKDEDEMLRFDVLLYICLRDISNEKTLMDVFYTQFPLNELQDLSHSSHIEAMIRQAENNKVLLIMDGLNEIDNSSPFITKIMQRILYPHLTVLATTRPWKIGQLSLIRSAHIDLLLDLQGFSYENSMLFAERIFDKYYRDESAVEQFKMDILSNKLIASLIHVPLLLLFIVHVWYERKSFPQQIHELYIDMLNVMVNRYMENKVRKQEDEERDDDKKCVLFKTRPLKSTTFILPPKLRNLSLVHCFGEEFLASLCEVANHFLIINAEKTSMVFYEAALVKLFGKDGLSKLHMAIELGILSESGSQGIFRKKINLTFLHKTIQEFLAAICISCREDRCSVFLNSLNTLDDVFQNENIITFVAGISMSHCQKISEKIYEICDTDRAMISEEGMRDLSRLYRHCIKEALGEPVTLKLYCMYADNQEDWNALDSALWNTSTVRTHLKRLYLNSSILYNAALDLSESNSLEYLSLVGVTMKGKLLLSKCTQLKCVTLQNCSLDDAILDCTSLTKLIFEDVTMNGKLLLSECTSLSRLCLKDVTMKGELLLSKCTRLKSLYLQSCTLDDATLNLSEFANLRMLLCNKVTMKGKLLLSKCTQLKCLKLSDCILDDAILDWSGSNSPKKFFCKNVSLTGRNRLSKCIPPKQLMLVKCSRGEFSLDLSVSTCLIKQVIHEHSQYKQLQSLSMKDAYIGDAVPSLDFVNHLIELNLDNITMSKECKELLCRSLSQCKQLHSLSIKNMDLDDALLSLDSVDCPMELNLDNVTMSKECRKVFCRSLSKCKHLHSVSIKNVDLDDAVLSLDSVDCCMELNLDNVTMSQECKEVFCRSLSQCKQLLSLSIKNVDLGDALLSLDSVDYHMELNLNNVTMSKECKEVFCRSLSQCKQLHSLSIKNVDLDDALLSLDSVDCHMELNLDNVTMSKECKEVFCRSLSQCKQLHSLSIKNVDLGDALLSFDSVDCHMELNLDNVTMSKECKEVFCRSLSQCKQLHSLSIKNVDLGDALLSLDSVDCHMELNLDNVTMSQECKEVFCRSLSKCKHLHSVSIKNVDLDDAVLSLDSVDCCMELNLDNVTMSQECKEVFCRSLSQCKQLHSLSIKNVDLGDALLSLDSVDYHMELNLNNVTMSKECKEVFCRSLSQCKQLHSLSIKNVDLDDALLSLDSVDCHMELNLDNVTMSKECKEVFCRSLSQCKQLHSLSIKNVDLGDALLSLDSVDCHMELNLDNVTMSKECKEVFCRSLSQCKQLHSLSIKNVDLGDALLSLDSVVCHMELNLDNVTMSKECKEVFYRSLSQCKQLHSLSIKNVDLGDALLSLDRTNKLYDLTIDNVTMCKNGYVMLFNSMSTCTQVKHLKLLNLDLGDAKPSLDNLEELELVNITMSLKYVDCIKSLVQHLNSSSFNLSFHHSVFLHARELSIEMTSDSCVKCVVNYTSKGVDDCDDEYCNDSDDGDDDDDEYCNDSDDDDYYYCDDDDDYCNDGDDDDDDDDDDD